MLVTQQPDLQPDQILHNRYHIIGRLDSGGFGVIYRAKDLRLNHEFVIKKNKDRSEDTQRRFTREAHLLVKLDHPSLPRIILLDKAVDDPGKTWRQYLVMDFIRGDDLQDHLCLRIAYSSLNSSLFCLHLFQSSITGKGDIYETINHPYSARRSRL